MVKLILRKQVNGGETLRLMGLSQTNPSSAENVSVPFTSLQGHHSDCLMFYKVTIALL